MKNEIETSPSLLRIPIIDLAIEDTDLLARQWSTVMEEVGFAVLINHGVPIESIEGVRRATEQFFRGSHEEKMKFNYSKEYGTCEGYTPTGVEAVARSELKQLEQTSGEKLSQEEANKAQPDLVENYVFDDQPDASRNEELLQAQTRVGSTPHHPLLCAAAEEYYREANVLLHRIHVLSALSLGLDSEYFQKFYGEACVEAKNSLRLAYYMPIGEGTEEEQRANKGAIRYGAHTDYMGFTLLLPDPKDKDGEGGLEVEMDAPNGKQWIGLGEVPKNAVVVNIGDLFHLWTNGKWKATRHRVSNPPPKSHARSRERISIVYFTGPRNDSVIEPLETCISVDRPRLFETIVAVEHLHAKLGLSNA